MAGYIRQDVPNNISNGNVINADDLDTEFNSIETAFNNTAGHSHNGEANEGAPITVVGPFQEVTIGQTEVSPKADNTISLGTALLRFKNLFLDYLKVRAIEVDTVNGSTVPSNGALVDGLRNLIAGNGLTGGGDLTANRTFNVGAGDGISVSADAVAVNATVARTARVIGTGAGSGLTGGGDLSVDRNLSVDSTVARTTRRVDTEDGIIGGGDLTTDRVFKVDNTVLRTSGNQTISGIKSFTGRLAVAGTSSSPSAEIRRTNANQNATLRFGTTANSDVTVGQGDGGWFNVGFGDDISSAANSRFRVRASDGRVEWSGSAVGNGAGITNVNAATVGGRSAGELVLKAGDTLTGGFKQSGVDSQTIGGGTYTVSIQYGNIKQLVNTGAFTIAAPPTSAGDFIWVARIHNAAGSGPISLSGFSRVAGDPFNDIDGREFILTVYSIGGLRVADVREV